MDGKSLAIVLKRTTKPFVSIDVEKVKI
jgi:hypothetical protein